jgi:L-cystine uptake protein TcyP (sodium:dicarboxylate symporter family)
MYWLVIATLYGALAGNVVGFVLAAAYRTVRGMDEIAWHVSTLVGAAIGLFFGLALDHLSRAERWPANKQTLIKWIGVLAALTVLWMIVLPAFYVAR